MCTGGLLPTTKLLSSIKESVSANRRGRPGLLMSLPGAEDFMTKNWSKEQQGIKDTVQGPGLGKKVECHSISKIRNTSSAFPDGIAGEMGEGERSLLGTRLFLFAVG